MNKGFLFLLFFVCISLNLPAQEWVVPADEAGKLSSFAFTDSTRKAGADLYNLNCKSCHGDPGKNNPVQMVPHPPDPASEQMQKNSDGSLHYKLSAGRGLMPSFKNTLSLTDTWKVISFIRSFNEKYVQEVAKKTELGLFADVKMVISPVQESNQVKVSVSFLKDAQRQAVAGAEIKLFAKRYFGNLVIDGPKNTNNLGDAYFNFPKDLPGDSLGVVELIAKPTDEAAFGEVKAEISLAIGQVNNRPALNEPRALWNVVSKTPIWLLITYTLTVLSVWGLIIFILLEVRRIYRSGQ